MTKKGRLFVLVLLALGSLGSAWAGPLEDQVLSMVNLQRLTNNLQPLTRSAELEAAAFRHSTDMATNDFMSHVGSDGSNAGGRITAAGYRWATYGENVAAGQSTAAQVMNAWMSSPGHRANILNPHFKEIGISVVYREEARWNYYWTQDFGARSLQPAPTPTPTPSPTPMFLPNLAEVQPRVARSGTTVLTLTGSNFGRARGPSRVAIHKRGTPVYAAVTYRTWSEKKITLTFQTPQRGWHFVQVIRGDGRASISALFYVASSGNRRAMRGLR